MQERHGTVLKACVFATGFSGIVAEYVMATMASYLLGNAVVQWTLTISLMLFAMGLGSRASRYLRGSLLDAFIGAELALSALCAASAPLAYLIAAYTPCAGPAIYGLACALGFLIGLEIPLATRLNDAYEELRVNVSSVIENDYYGALLGGLIFAFVALPHLGLTRTPIALGAVNFAVAGLLFWGLRSSAKRRRLLSAGFALVAVVLGALALWAEPIVLFGEQQKYRDRIVYREVTPYQKIVITRWKDDHWLYLDRGLQFSSRDEALYHEPLVHPAMFLASSKRRILVLGGGDGLAVREILKHSGVETVTLVDLDPAMTRLGREHPILLELNGGVLDDPRVEIVNEDGFHFLERTREVWDVIVVDLPDPKTVSLARLYSRQFYELAGRQLSAGGVLVTQATSPLFAREAFSSILATVRSAGFAAVPYHNHVPTMGEWGWVLGRKPPEGAALATETLRAQLLELPSAEIETRFLNREAMLSMLHFGKGTIETEVEVTETSNLAVYHYYRQGDWDLY